MNEDERKKSDPQTPKLEHQQTNSALKNNFH